MIFCIVLTLAGAAIHLLVKKCAELGRITFMAGIFGLVYMVATGHQLLLR
jgi:hypothetical protein